VNRLAEIWQVSNQDVQGRLASNLRQLVQNGHRRP
jgi:hypothetical protein